MSEFHCYLVARYLSGLHYCLSIICSLGICHSCAKYLVKLPSNLITKFLLELPYYIWLLGVELHCYLVVK